MTKEGFEEILFLRKKRLFVFNSVFSSFNFFFKYVNFVKQKILGKTQKMIGNNHFAPNLSLCPTLLYIQPLLQSENFTKRPTIKQDYVDFPLPLYSLGGICVTVTSAGIRLLVFRFQGLHSVLLQATDIWHLTKILFRPFVVARKNVFSSTWCSTISFYID